VAAGSPVTRLTRSPRKNRDKVALENSRDELLKWLPETDFAVIGHGIRKHGRDYVLLVEACLGSNPGQHKILFTHCVKAECETRVRGEVWRKSWSEEFADYERWTSVGEPDGYVWGTNWSVAHPVFRAVLDSVEAAEQNRRLGKQCLRPRSKRTASFCRQFFISSVRGRRARNMKRFLNSLNATHRPASAGEEGRHRAANLRGSCRCARARYRASRSEARRHHARRAWPRAHHRLRTCRNFFRTGRDQRLNCIA